MGRINRGTTQITQMCLSFHDNGIEPIPTNH